MCQAPRFRVAWQPPMGRGGWSSWDNMAVCLELCAWDIKELQRKGIKMGDRAGLVGQESAQKGGKAWADFYARGEMWEWGPSSRIVREWLVVSVTSPLSSGFLLGYFFPLVPYTFQPSLPLKLLLSTLCYAPAVSPCPWYPKSPAAWELWALFNLALIQLVN